MGTRVAVVGLGAIGGQVGASLVRGGEDVVLIDQWPENVAHIRKHGIKVDGMTPQETYAIPAFHALNICDVQQLAKGKPIDVVMLSVKSYDTTWATAMIKPYLAEDGFVCSMQNCINEEKVASVVGWGKTLGISVATLGAELVGPGHVVSAVRLLDLPFSSFRVGEVHGRITPRAEEVARLLRHCSSAEVTTNLWGERWSKLVVNAMRNGLSAITGVGGNARDDEELTRRIGMQLGAEAVRVGHALGYTLGKILNMQAEELVRAADGDKAALAEVVGLMRANASVRSDAQRPSMLQDIVKGRRTETDDINGFVCVKGAEVGIPTPMNAAIHELVKRVERGELKPSLDNVKELENKALAFA